MSWYLEDSFRKLRAHGIASISDLHQNEASGVVKVVPERPRLACSMDLVQYLVRRNSDQRAHRKVWTLRSVISRLTMCPLVAFQSPHILNEYLSGWPSTLLSTPAEQVTLDFDQGKARSTIGSRRSCNVDTGLTVDRCHLG